MIKRALGLWGDEGNDADEGLTAKEHARLTKRFLPGGQVRTGADYALEEDGEAEENSSVGEEPAEDDDDDEDGDSLISGDEAYDSDDSDGPQNLEVEVEPKKEKPFRGNFHCKLCPDKVILTEEALEKHLASKLHLKRERDFEKAKDMGLAAFEAQVMAKVKEREEKEQDAANGSASKRAKRKEEYWAKKREKRKLAHRSRKDKNDEPAKAPAKPADEKSAKEKETGTTAKEPSAEVVNARKAAFQAKKSKKAGTQRTWRSSGRDGRHWRKCCRERRSPGCEPRGEAAK